MSDKASVIVRNHSIDYDSLGDIYIVNGQILKADRYYDTALQIDPNNLKAKWGKANVKMALRDFEGQLQILNEIIEKDSLYHAAYFYRGIANMAIERYDAALLDFQKSIELNVEVSESYVRIAYLFNLKNDNKSAIKFHDLAIKHSPSSPKHYIERGYYYLDMGDTIRFCRDYSKSKKLGLLDSIAKGEYPGAKEDIKNFNSICNK
ncbi:MAG: tetratricopeptide repeat protein [Bacteroidota bacterium]